jgi:hypothetical protein
MSQSDRPTLTSREAPDSAERFAQKLQQDVRSWSAREGDASDQAADAALALGAKQAKAAASARKRKPAAAPVAAAPEAKNRPFSMSYEGMTNQQYIAGRIARGAR